MKAQASARSASVKHAVIATAIGGVFAASMGLTPAAYADTPTTDDRVQRTSSQQASDYLVTDNYPDLDEWLQGIGEATTVKVTAGTIGTGSTTLPAQVNLLTGWEKNFFADSEKTRQLGYGDADESFTFEGGSNATIRSINFKLAQDKLVVPNGANVTFKNVTFSNRIVIEKGATASFVDCIFTSGTIMNQGTTSYSGSTEEPTNDVSQQSTFQPLALAISDSSFDVPNSNTVWAVYNTPLRKTIDLGLTGTNASQAHISAETTGIEGLSAIIEDGNLRLTGTPQETGTATIKLTATAPDEGGASQTASAILNVEVNAKLSLTLEGRLDAVRTGQGDYQDTKYHEVEMVVAENSGQGIAYATWQQTHDGTEVSSSIDQTSGLRTAFWNAGGNSSITVFGTACTPGTYRVHASLTYKGQTVTAESSDLRIYEGTETLAGQLASITGTPSEWQMEPYEIWRSDNAIIPTWLHRITGSDESGLYGQIGNNGTDNGSDAFASDTLTIPAGADVTLENIKINSSVKIVVEAGARLTMLDSAAFGPIEVNGGTLHVQRDDVRHSGFV